MGLLKDRQGGVLRAARADTEFSSSRGWRSRLRGSQAWLDRSVVVVLNEPVDAGFLGNLACGVLMAPDGVDERLRRFRGNERCAADVLVSLVPEFYR